MAAPQPGVLDPRLNASPQARPQGLDGKTGEVIPTMSGALRMSRRTHTTPNSHLREGASPLLFLWEFPGFFDSL